MSSDSKIYVDAGRPATLNDGAGKLTDCATLQGAVLAWHALPSAQKIRATVKVIGGRCTRRIRSIGFTTGGSRRVKARATISRASSARSATAKQNDPDEAGRRNCGSEGGKKGDIAQCDKG
jgi:hypothetical protein